MHHTLIRACPAFVLLLLVGAPAAGQYRSPWSPEVEQERLVIDLWGGGEYQDETDIEGGGSMDVYRGGVGLDIDYRLSIDLDLSVRFQYRYDEYDFRGTTRLGGRNPWNDIHTLRGEVVFTSHVSNAWSLFAGPVIELSRESSFDTHSAVIGGGVIGATFTAGNDVLVGGGLGVTSKLEDDARVFPVLIIDWAITDQLSLATNTRASTGGLPAIELVYDLGQNFEVALGKSFQHRRFRLDNTGIAPDGIGEEKREPWYVRLAYRLNPTSELSLLAGVDFNGELRLEDDDGVRINKEDYKNESLFVSATLSLTF